MLHCQHKFILSETFLCVAAQPKLGHASAKKKKKNKKKSYRINQGFDIVWNSWLYSELANLAMIVSVYKDDRIW